MYCNWYNVNIYIYICYLPWLCVCLVICVNCDFQIGSVCRSRLHISRAAPNVRLPWTCHCHFCACRARRGNSQRLAKSSPYAGPSAGAESARLWKWHGWCLLEARYGGLDTCSVSRSRLHTSCLFYVYRLISVFLLVKLGSVYYLLIYNLVGCASG